MCFLYLYSCTWIIEGIALEKIYKQTNKQKKINAHMNASSTQVFIQKTNVVLPLAGTPIMRLDKNL